jgi:hypothetical protein
MKAKLALLYPGPEEEINIFIHGYSAISNSKEFDKLAFNIIRAKPIGKVWLLYWKSGNWKEHWAATLPNIIFRLSRFAKIINPYAIAGEALFFVGAKIAHYKLYEKRAENLGTQLKRYICRIPKVKEHKINFIGHSLGARIIHHALSKNSWSDYQIHDCIFLGGDTEANANDWNKCAKEIKGKFYNAYSKKDMVLMIKPSFKRKAIGRYPITLTSTKVINRQYSFGHTRYWPRLYYILPQLWSNYQSSKIDDLIISKIKLYRKSVKQKKIKGMIKIIDAQSLLNLTKFLPAYFRKT